MKDFFITILLVLAASWIAIGQSATRAPTNIAVSESTIMAVYPEMAEFSINIPACQLTIVRIDEDGNDHQSTYQARLMQSRPDVYRAEFCGDSWLELDTVTGETTLYHKKMTEVFCPPRIVTVSK